MLCGRARLTGAMAGSARQDGVAMSWYASISSWLRHVERAYYFAEMLLRAMAAFEMGANCRFEPPSWRAAGVIRPVTARRVGVLRFHTAPIPSAMLCGRARLTGAVTGPARQDGVAMS